MVDVRRCRASIQKKRDTRPASVAGRSLFFPRADAAAIFYMGRKNIFTRPMFCFFLIGSYYRTEANCKSLRKTLAGRRNRPRSLFVLCLPLCASSLVPKA
ncbi:hypothetical protein TW95_gp0976 [Pandoravirus inopinatum]|uniref:Uncharacterized protein n=1 Tax=Pandoravirus inopinatum TaxID=1605721 RepID=A0A0B5J7A2_9VIRU|nr:hypothetical protein TW95_gp0976 [Pandoravirus inopinatum]AJF97710.1 hypothetical protein [Pandoravirus inopinatum]